ncbi:MAG: FAD-dependent oxidoreductase, partial [Myxococcota bacterium]|nr:FAD-dependent oxidoreductase [Myxococcota bacterium]
MPLDLSALHTAGIAASAQEFDREPYRRDLWPRTTLELTRNHLPPAPAAVAWPTSAAQVRTIIDWAVQRGVPLVPFGAGSGVCGAAAGREGSLAVDTKRMDAVLEFDPDERTVRVQPGILGQHLEDILEPMGWMTAHSPSSIMCSTVGGYVAARSAGQFSSRYGVFDDMLLAASAECPTRSL